MSDKIIINLTYAAPVRIGTDEWPIIASGSAGGTDAKAEIIVRQHADGRVIVAGYLTGQNGSGEEVEYTAGKLHDPVIGIGVASAIEFVTSRLAVPPAHVRLVGRNPAREAQYNCVNNLPPVDL